MGKDRLRKDLVNHFLKQTYTITQIKFDDGIQNAKGYLSDITGKIKNLEQYKDSLEMLLRYVPSNEDKEKLIELVNEHIEIYERDPEAYHKHAVKSG